MEVKYNLMLGGVSPLEFCFGREPEGKNSDNVKIFCFDYFRTKCLEFPFRDGFCFGFFGFVIFFYNKYIILYYRKKSSRAIMKKKDFIYRKHFLDSSCGKCDFGALHSL